MYNSKHCLYGQHFTCVNTDIVKNDTTYDLLQKMLQNGKNLQQKLFTNKSTLLFLSFILNDVLQSNQ